MRVVPDAGAFAKVGGWATIALSCSLVAPTLAQDETPPSGAPAPPSTGVEPETAPQVDLQKVPSLPSVDAPKPKEPTLPLQRSSPPRSPASMWGSASLVMKPVERWYGWQTMIPVIPADIVMAAVGLEISDSGFGMTFPALFVIPVHLLSGPIVHWAHGHVGRGFGVLAMNLLPPIVGFVHPVAFIAGYFLPPVIDVAFLSKETAYAPIHPPKGAAALLPSSFALVPTMDTNRRGLTVIGQF